VFSHLHRTLTRTLKSQLLKTLEKLITSRLRKS